MQPATKLITECSPMQKTLKLACVTVLLLLTCGCQSYSIPPPHMVVTECKPTPAPAAWFWATKGLSTLADEGKFETITRRINGGLNGLADRQMLYTRALKVLA